jgi:hypothetical protein
VIQGLTLDRDDQLGDDREHLSSTLLKHVEDTLNREEAVRVLLLADALEEDGQVVMVVELLDHNLPVDTELRAMLNGNGEVAAVIETTELGGRNGSVVEGTGPGLLSGRLVLRLEEAGRLSSETLSLLDGS